MGNVIVIPAKRQIGNTGRKQDANPKLRVAAYCRVSTDSDEQATSYEAQVEHYTEYIKKNPEWEFAGIYADDGISGTNTKNREEFNRMIEDCEAGTIDMIITKSISRFARNTLDCLKYIRQLKENNIPVFFEKEAINTMDAKGEVLLTIMASLAQQESQSLSQNVKLGLQFRYQNVQNHNRFLGYTKDEEGNHEAIIPREIYMLVQEELVRRRVVKTSANGKKRSYSCNHCFSQIIICGDCGEMFRRIHWNNRGCKSIVWRCISKLEPTGLECHAKTINELDLQEIVLTALNELLGDKSKYQKQLQQNIASVIRASAAITTDGIDEKLMELQQELVKKANNKEAYDEIADQIFALREKRQQASMDTVQRDEQLQRITEMQDFIKDQPSDLTVFDEALVKRWLKQIVIWPTHCTVELKSGLKVDVER